MWIILSHSYPFDTHQCHVIQEVERDFSNNRHLSSKQNPLPNYKQYTQGMTNKLLGLPNTWVLMNCSTNMCQSDTGWFITLKQQGQNLLLLELPYLYFIGGLEDAWKTVPWPGVKNKMTPQISSFRSYHQNMKIFLSQLVGGRPVNRLNCLNLHPIAHQKDRYISSVSTI